MSLEGERQAGDPEAEDDFWARQPHIAAVRIVGAGKVRCNGDYFHAGESQQHWRSAAIMHPARLPMAVCELRGLDLPTIVNAQQPSSYHKSP
jgi:hypothetical protein